jgi:hypothetical protein
VHRTIASRFRRWLNGRKPADAAVGSTPSTAAPDETASRVTAPEQQPDDSHVRAWKSAWVGGAEGRWAAKPIVANPHAAGSPQSAAWRAGWHWADRPPARRDPNAVRFAHQYRRTADLSLLRGRRTQAAAVGLSALTIAGWLWHIRRQRTRPPRES